MAEMNCPRCGASLEADAAVCSMCGTELHTRYVEPPPQLHASPASSIPLFVRNEPLAHKGDVQQSTQSFPSEALALAQKYQLGVPTSMYTTVNVTRITSASLGLTIFLFAFALLRVALHIVTLLTPLILALAGLFLLITISSIVFKRRYRIYLCTEGCIFRIGRSTTAAPWNLVTDVHVPREIDARGNAIIKVCDIFFANGTSITLRASSIQDFDSLANKLERVVRRLQGQGNE